MPADGKGDPRSLVIGPQRDRGGYPSPDGRWLAYASDQTGRLEIYVQPFADSGQRQQVSQQGASTAWWTRDGRALVFADDGDQRTVWSVDMTAGATLQIGAPVKLATLPPGVVSIAAMPDRRRFLAIVEEHAGQGSLTIVQNWLAALTNQAR